MNTDNTTPAPPHALPPRRRWWQRTRLWVLVSILVLIPCLQQLWRHADYSYVAYRVRDFFRTRTSSSTPGTTQTINRLLYANTKDPLAWRRETYIVQINQDGTLTRLEEQGSWDDFESIYTSNRKEIWFVDRDFMLECQHWLIPWHFKGRFGWNVRSSAFSKPPPDIEKSVLTFLRNDLGPESARGKEITQALAGNDTYERHDWFAFAINFALIASTSYLLFTFLSLPWLIRRRYQERRLHKSFVNCTCLKCNYDLSATRVESGVRTCPECGATNQVAATPTT